jgi:hypothetical protein
MVEVQVTLLQDEIIRWFSLGSHKKVVYSTKSDLGLFKRSKLPDPEHRVQGTARRRLETRLEHGRSLVFMLSP